MSRLYLLWNLKTSPSIRSSLQNAKDQNEDWKKNGDQFWRCNKDQDSDLEDLEWRSILVTSKISFEDQNPRYHLEDLEWSFEITKKT